MQLTIKKEIEETVNIELPIFFKNPTSQEYIGVLNEDTFIKFMQGSSTCSYINSKLNWWTSEFNTAFQSWNRISEEDFLNIHADFLKFQSLEPVLVEADDLKDINI